MGTSDDEEGGAWNRMEERELHQLIVRSRPHQQDRRSVSVFTSHPVWIHISTYEVIGQHPTHPANKRI